jgi:hypothetical protein
VAEFACSLRLQCHLAQCEPAQVLRDAGVATFFRGLFPIESPHFDWGESIPLPWHDQYWNKCADGQTSSPKQIDKEVKIIARLLMDIADVEGPARPGFQATYLSAALAATKMGVVQGLAVEAMLAVDRFLVSVSKRRIPQSISCLTSAHGSIVECTCQAHLILSGGGTHSRGPTPTHGSGLLH